MSRVAVAVAALACGAVLAGCGSADKTFSLEPSTTGPPTASSTVAPLVQQAITETCREIRQAEEDSAHDTAYRSGTVLHALTYAETKLTSPDYTPFIADLRAYSLAVEQAMTGNAAFDTADSSAVDSDCSNLLQP